MFYKLRATRKQRHFYQLTQQILETTPIEVVDADWSIISMVSNADVQMYILSIKSFYARIGRGKIVAIVDRDMPLELRRMLSEHVRGLQFVILEDIDTGRCQRGGTWERLFYLLKHSESEYAIQLDSDTLAFGPNLTEVMQCAENNRAFTLNQNYNEIRTMQEYRESAQNLNSKYLGIYVEQMFDRYPGYEHLRYVRASSGLTGFAHGGFSPTQIEEFHEIMRGIVGDQTWRRWGTEQCGSNFAVANSPNAFVLPYPKYGNFDPIAIWPGVNTEDAAFVHFIGTYRYEHDFFAEKACGVIRQLLSAA